ncbi:hypothetical protein BGZ54_002893 [Gamsiella multidivaricata]|nr:hypothetical protein BGZ54_002893 [Gamsiella multidivaricata]
MSGAVKTKEFLIHDGPGEDLSLVATDVENEECDRATSIASAMPTAAFDTVKFDEPVTSASYSTADTQSSLGHHGTLHHDNSDHQSTEYSEHANHGDTIDPEGFESNSNITFNSTDDNHCLDAVPGITALRRNGNKLFEAPRHPNKEEKPLLNSGNYSIKDSRQSVYRVVIPTPRQNQRRQQRYGKYTYARPTTRVSFIPWSERGYCMEYSNQDVPISSTLMDGQPYAENTDMVRAFSPNEVQQFAGGSNDEGEEEDWEDTTTDNDEQEPKIPTISQHHIHSRAADSVLGAKL